MNGPKFLLTIQFCSTTTGNVWLSLLLPKEGQAVIGILTMSILEETPGQTYDAVERLCFLAGPEGP